MCLLSNWVVLSLEVLPLEICLQRAKLQDLSVNAFYYKGKIYHEGLFLKQWRLLGKCEIHTQVVKKGRLERSSTS